MPLRTLLLCLAYSTSAVSHDVQCLCSSTDCGAQLYVSQYQAPSPLSVRDTACDLRASCTTVTHLGPVQCTAAV